MQHGAVDPQRAPTLTIAVLTHNEAQRVEACLRSAAFADQVVVVDSGSTDATVGIARSLGAEVHSHADWQGFAVQRNRLLQHARGDYVFFLDADEVITPQLQQEIEAIVRSGERAVWRVRWRMVAFGRELKYYRSTSAVERLFRREMILRYEGVVHEGAIIEPADTPRRLMRARLLHHSRDSIHGSLAKLTQYVMLGAAKRADAGKRGGVLRGLASGSAMFLRLYLLHGGILCGGAGFLYCLFVALEAFFRYTALEYDRDSLSVRVTR
jgi:glycosyltransferase involved in cell wall biosynthesis